MLKNVTSNVARITSNNIMGSSSCPSQSPWHIQGKCVYEEYPKHSTPWTAASIS